MCDVILVNSYLINPYDTRAVDRITYENIWMQELSIRPWD